MHAEKKEMLLQNRSIRQQFLQIVVLSHSHKKDIVFFVENVSNTLSAKQNWIAVKAFSSKSCQVSFFMSWAFFSLPSSAFLNPLWVKMTFILICHLLKLMTPSNFWISNLIADIFTLILLWYQLLWIRGCPYDWIDWAAQRKLTTWSTKVTWRREEEDTPK